MFRILFTSLILASTALAAEDNRILITAKTTALSSVACNASAVSRTFTIPGIGSNGGVGYSLVVFELNHNTHASATHISLACKVNTDLDMQECSNLAGVCTSSDATWTKAVSSTKKWPWRGDVLGFLDAVCTVSCTAGGAGDTVSVAYYLTTAN